MIHQALYLIPSETHQRYIQDISFFFICQFHPTVSLCAFPVDILMIWEDRGYDGSLLNIPALLQMLFQSSLYISSFFFPPLSSSCYFFFPSSSPINVPYHPFFLWSQGHFSFVCIDRHTVMV